uniref:Uncharacterized protein n=1 Tax=Plectus sambesii TaxID=2011161 RepID=A0A914VTN7_9BILA
MLPRSRRDTACYTRPVLMNTLYNLPLGDDRPVRAYTHTHSHIHICWVAVENDGVDAHLFELSEHRRRTRADARERGLISGVDIIVEQTGGQQQHDAKTNGRRAAMTDSRTRRWQNEIGAGRTADAERAILAVGLDKVKRIGEHTPAASTADGLLFVVTLTRAHFAKSARRRQTAAQPMS